MNWKSKLRYTLPRLALTALLAAAPLGYAAEQFPTRPVRMIVPYAPGGATDNTARLLANKLTEMWGQQVIVDNRPGGSGIIAMDLAVNAAPDGYTLFVGNVSTNAINETALAKRLKFKPSQALTGVTNLIELPHFFLVNPTLPVHTIKELFAYAKTHKVAYASAGVASYPHLDVAMLLKAGGVTGIHVPYKGGAGQMIPAVISNEAQLMELNMGSIYPHIKAGRVRPLATTWPTRLKELPDVPTMAEAGYPGIGTNAWNGLFAPAKIPKARLAKIHDDVVTAMEGTDTKVALDKLYMTVVVNKTPAEFQKFVEDDVKKWAKVLEETHISID